MLGNCYEKLILYVCTYKQQTPSSSHVIKFALLTL